MFLKRSQSLFSLIKFVSILIFTEGKFCSWNTYKVHRKCTFYVLLDAYISVAFRFPFPQLSSKYFSLYKYVLKSLYYFRLFIIVSKTFCSVLKERENAIEEPMHVHDLDDLEGNYNLIFIYYRDWSLYDIPDILNANEANFLLVHTNFNKRQIFVPMSKHF